MKEARRMIIICIWFHIEFYKMQIYLEIWEGRSEIAWAWGVGVLVVGWQGHGGTKKAGKENYKGAWGNFEHDGYVQCGDGFTGSTNGKTYQTVYFKYVYFTIHQLYKNKRLWSWPSQCRTLYNVNVNDSGLLEFSLPTVWKEMIPQALPVLSAWLHQGSLIPAVISLWWSQALPISLKTWKTGKAPSWQDTQKAPVISLSESPSSVPQSQESTLTLCGCPRPACALCLLLLSALAGVQSSSPPPATWHLSSGSDSGLWVGLSDRQDFIG